MKKERNLCRALLLVPVLSLFFSIGLRAQISISSDLFYDSSSVSLTVLDSLKKTPLEYVSVFLVPLGDSTITHFTLSDSLGIARLDEVTRGAYLLNIEQMGYHPVQRELYVRRERETLGNIYMREDKKVLQSAKITGVVNPIVMKQDTIEYNAAAFASGENDMLGDLLEKMPGMEVDKEGNVKVNGESVSKITVGGKSFFFDDKKTALNNLPAKIVDKVKVINKDSEAAEFSGIADAKKEKVMDVELKADYKKGWFGNAGLQGGSAIKAGKEDDPLRGGRGALYNGNVLAAAYSEDTQVTVVANANNVKEAGGMTIFVVSDGESSTPGDLVSASQLGVNVTSDAIKGMSLEGMVNYRADVLDNASRSSRVTFMQDGDDLLTESSASSKRHNNKFEVEFELANAEQDKFMFELAPFFELSGNNSLSHSSSSMADSSGELNDTRSDGWSKGRKWNTGSYLVLGVKDMGRKGRSLTFEGYGSVSKGNSLRKNYSEYAHSGEMLNLFYDGGEDFSGMNGELSYVEPVAEFWSLRTELLSEFSISKDNRTAYSPSGGNVGFVPSDEDRNSFDTVNDYYSSFADSRYTAHSADLLLQWDKSPTRVQFGASVSAVKNEVRSRTFGIESSSGEGEWLVNWAPYLNFSHNMDKASLSVNYSARTSRPSTGRMLPALDLTDPSYPTIGNVYLRPSFRQYLSVYLNGGNPKAQTSYYVSLFGSATSRGIVSASWSDKEGIRYAVPVNSARPSLSLSLNTNFSFPVDGQKRLTLAFSLNPNISRSVSYQAAGRGEGIALDSFDYGEFMSEFWGSGTKGENFYSGKSGFVQSSTFSFLPNASFTARYRLDAFDIRARYAFDGRISKFSFDPSANVNTRVHRCSLDLQYTSPHGFEFSTDMIYLLYRGYRYGYGDPEFEWNIGVSKSVKAFTFSLGVYDILNSRTSLRTTSSENWYENSHSLILGRYVMLGVKWNFGKMNRSNASAANNAALFMSF